MAQINVTAKGDFGYHPATGLTIVQGEQYTIDEEAFSDVLFDRVGAPLDAPSTITEGGNEE